MNTLAMLTKQESGIVVYTEKDKRPEAIICNWSGINGIPRLFGDHLIGLGDIGDYAIAGDRFEGIEVTAVQDIGAELGDAEIIYDENGDAESLQGLFGAKWTFSDPSRANTIVEVYAPQDWA